MGGYGSHESADGVGENSFRSKISVSHRIKHCSVGAEVSAPAHTDSGENTDGVAVNPAFTDKLREKAQSGTDSSKCGDRESDEMRILKTEEPLENKVYLADSPGSSSTP